MVGTHHDSPLCQCGPIPNRFLHRRCRKPLFKCSGPGDLQNVCFLKVGNQNFKLGKSFYEKQSQFGGVSRQPRVIHCSLLDKTLHLIHQVAFLDLMGSSWLRERANVPAAFEHSPRCTPA